MPRRALPVAFLLALLLSALGHLVLLFGTDFELAAMPEPSPPVLHAELQQVPLPVPPAASPPPSPRKPSSRPKPSPVAAPLGAPAAIPVTAAATPTPVPAAPAVSIPNLSGGIRYQLIRGGQGLIVGQTQHRWELQDGSYRITSVMETTGLAALFRSVRVEQSSTGRIDAAGFHPATFRASQTGKDSVGADFADGRVTTLGQAALPAPEDAQDLLSFHYQLGWTQRQGVQTVALATGKKFDRIRFEMVGEETLELPAGTFRTRHYRSSGEDVTEVWSALDHAGLPVKIRHTDRKGEVFDQIALDIEMSIKP